MYLYILHNYVSIYTPLPLLHNSSPWKTSGPRCSPFGGNYPQRQWYGLPNWSVLVLVKTFVSAAATAATTSSTATNNDVSKCALSMHVFTVIPPRLSYPCNFINCTASKQRTGADEILLCSVTTHGLHTVHARFESSLQPSQVIFWPPVVCYLLLFYASSHV